MNASPQGALAQRRPSLRRSRAASLMPLAFALTFALASSPTSRAGSPPPLALLDSLYPTLDALYIDLHQTPELSLQETKTAAKMASRLKALGYEVTEHIGGNGVVGVLRNGDGPTIMLRTDMDALPVKEQTGLPIASTVTTTNSAGDTVPVMHACGHDAHMASWIGAAALLAQTKDQWRGTLVFVGQPAEEVVHGARAMIDDGLFTKFPKPDYVLGIHVFNLFPAGQVGVCPGPASAASNSVDVTFFGKGGHGAMPNLTIDPILIAARTVVTLQSIVSREIDPRDPAVVTVGTFHGGFKRNIIPDEAKIQLTVRCYKPEVQKQILAAIARIAKAEAAAAGAPREPKVEVIESESAEVVTNDPALTARLTKALGKAIGESNVVSDQPSTTSEDFGLFGRVAGVPSVQFRVGAIAPDVFEEATKKHAVLLLPGPHSPLFAPDRERTIRTGVAVFTLSALDLLGKPSAGK